MTIAWRFTCDGERCNSMATVEPLTAAPPGWLVRTIIDQVPSLEEGATGTGFPRGASTLESFRHYCPACRRKLKRAA